jgi:hypothetical protein
MITTQVTGSVQARSSFFRCVAEAALCEPDEILSVIGSTTTPARPPSYRTAQGVESRTVLVRYAMGHDLLGEATIRREETSDT